MPLPAAPSPFPETQPGDSVRDLLRCETRGAHDAIDARYGMLPLDRAEGYRDFLAAHLLAWSALAAPWSRQLRRLAGAAPPDYPALLRADLAELTGAPALPAALTPPSPPCDAGVAYVLAGSRIGIATIRRRPNWGARHGRAQRFLNERHGGALFLAVVMDLERGPGGDAQRADLVASARLAFAVFHDALDAVGGARQ